MQIQRNHAAADRIVSRLAEQQGERGDFGAHVSDLTACLRRRWLDHHQPVAGPSPFTLTFLRGSALHQLLSGEAEEAQLQVEGLIGTIDHIDRDGRLWEWKTTMIWSGKLDDPAAWPESWLMQVAAYVYMAKQYCLIQPNSIDSINVGVLHLQGDGRDNRLPQLRVYRITFTPEELQQNWLTLQARSAIVTAVDEPPATYRLGAWECKNCPHLSHCLPDLKAMGDRIKTPVEETGSQ